MRREEAATPPTSRLTPMRANMLFFACSLVLEHDLQIHLKSQNSQLVYCTRPLLSQFSPPNFLCVHNAHCSMLSYSHYQFASVFITALEGLGEYWPASVIIRTQIWKKGFGQRPFPVRWVRACAAHAANKLATLGGWHASPCRTLDCMQPT